MNFDINTMTVSWQELPFQNAPFLTKGGFHKYWRHNLTAFSWTAGLNDFDLNFFNGTCISDQIITYDYQNLRFEITIPEGAEIWKNTSLSSCSRYVDDIYCFGGINCTDFTDNHLLWTKYNIISNTITKLNSTGIEDVLSRELGSITCIDDEKKCLIGAGQAIAAGTVDQWVFYNIRKDKFIILDPQDKPTNLQYISPDVAETWKLIDEKSDFEVIKNGPLLMTGGDNASHILLSSDTIRYIAGFQYKNEEKFKVYPSNNLFTIKGQVLKNIPKLRHYHYPENNVLDEEQCSYFIEYGGKEQNEVTHFHYINQPVLFTVCRK